MREPGAAEKLLPAKFHLNNCVFDPSFLREALAAELYLRAEVPAPQARHARVTLNGRDLGFYALVEPVNASFLRAHFQNDNGIFFEGKGGDIDQKLFLKSSPEPNAQRRLEQLVSAAQEEGAEVRWGELSRVLDVDRFIRLLAMETLTGQVDGYAMKRNNYSLYHDPAAGKWVMIGRGLDRAFRDTVPRVFPPGKQLLTRAVLGTAEGRELYLKTFSRLLDEVMQPARVTNWIAEHAAVLVSASKTGEEAAAVKANTEELARYILQRHADASRLLEQIERGPVKVAAGASLDLSGWRYRAETNMVWSEAVTNGVETLYLGCPGGIGRGAWRTKVYLEAGEYVFSGRVRTARVSDRKGALHGASLYTSEQPIGLGRLSGTTEWTEMRQAFALTNGPAEVEFIAELRTKGGETWFDKGSFRVRRERMKEEGRKVPVWK